MHSFVKYKLVAAYANPCRCQGVAEACTSYQSVERKYNRMMR